MAAAGDPRLDRHRLVRARMDGRRHRTAARTRRPRDRHPDLAPAGVPRLGHRARQAGLRSPAVRRTRLPPDRTGPGANLGPVPALRALRRGHDNLPESGHDRGPAHPGPAGDGPPGPDDGAAARDDNGLAGQHGEPAAAGVQPDQPARGRPGRAQDTAVRSPDGSSPVGCPRRRHPRPLAVLLALGAHAIRGSAAAPAEEPADVRAGWHLHGPVHSRHPRRGEHRGRRRRHRRPPDARLRPLGPVVPHLEPNLVAPARLRHGPVPRRRHDRAARALVPGVVADRHRSGWRRHRPGRRHRGGPVERGEQPARLRRGRGRHPGSQPPPAHRTADRDQRRACDRALGVAGHADLGRALPSCRSHDQLAAVHGDRRADGGGSADRRGRRAHRDVLTGHWHEPRPHQICGRSCEWVDLVRVVGRVGQVAVEQRGQCVVEARGDEPVHGAG